MCIGMLTRKGGRDVEEREGNGEMEGSERREWRARGKCIGEMI